MRGRRLLLPLALLVGLVAAGLLLWPRGGFFPGAPSADSIYRVEIAQGRAQVVLEKRLDTGEWIIPSAEDAPADPARVTGLVRALLALSPGDPVAVPDGEPIAVRLSDRSGEPVAFAGVWPGVVQRLPDGPAVAAALPAIPLAPSPWSTLAAPRIAASDVVSAVRVTADGPRELDGGERAALARDLAALSADGFVPARLIDWSGASYFQVRLADGRTLEVQLVQGDAGARFARLTAETDPAFRQLRRFAFPVRPAVPARASKSAP